MKDFERFASESFRNDYHYDKPLGAFCGPEGTKIYLWAPTAESVFLHFYAKGNGGVSMETIPMDARWQQPCTEERDKDTMKLFIQARRQPHGSKA